MHFRYTFILKDTIFSTTVSDICPKYDEDTHKHRLLNFYQLLCAGHQAHFDEKCILLSFVRIRAYILFVGHMCMDTSSIFAEKR